MYRRVLLLAVAAALSAGSLLIACSPDDTDAAATPTATPGGEADTPTPDARTPTPSPEATPTGGPRDTDGDGLNDADEVRYGTHPGVADTDGDGFSDKEEVDNWDRLGGNHLRFNPLVADVPRLQARSLGAPVIQLYATTEESSTVRRGMTDENSSQVQVTTSRGRTNVHKIEEQHAVGVNGEVRKSGPITTGKVSASYDYQHTDTTTQTNYWDQTTVETNRQASSQYFETINSETVTTKGGEIKVVMGLLNDGDVSYTLNNMELAAYMEDPRQPGSLIAVGTLRHDGPLAFTPDPLGPAADPDPAAFTPFTFGYRAEDNPEEISRVLESADQLVLEPTNLSLTGSRPDVDLNLAAQNIRARTAEVIIDFGDHDGLATERYRVAIDRGGEQDLALDDLMDEVLDFDYTFSTGRFPGMSESHQGLTSVRTVAMNSDTNSYWLAAHTSRPPGSAPGTEETTLYNILSDDYEASDIRLGKGDVLHLVYITDTDLDGLSDRLERLNGTRLDDADSDGDGLDDALETYGWLTNLSGPPCDGGDALTLVVSNPLQPDSDGDGIADSEEMASCANPMGELTVHAGEDRVASADEVVTLAASPSNYLDSGALRYQWTQTGGPSVGQLPAAPRITFSAPQEVTSLFFEATVTDTQQNGQSATDSVRVLVARDKDRSVFVDADSGHDFNNSGATPDDALATLERALEPRFGGADVYLKTPAVGAYTPAQTLVVDSGASLYGGFDADWARDPEGSRTPIHVAQPVALEARDFSDLRLSGLSIEANAHPDGSKNSFAVHASDGGRLLLDNVTVQGSDLSLSAEVASDGSTDFVSASSYGVFATRLDRLGVVDSTIRAGRGTDGPKGTPGANGATGDSGSNGGVNGGGRGGDGNGNGAAGGRGGDGATKVVTCASGSGGSKGGNGAGGVTGGGGGSAGRADAQVFTCSISSGGSGGSVTSRASSGNAGTPAEMAAEFPEGLYLPAHGTTGTKGGGGAGGGGGGGGAGANFRDGGGGGGGGEGGDGGAGGAGGRGAGGSFAMALNDVSFASVAGSELQSGDGGSGGPGGAGGRGGAGGSGGRGGNVSNNDARDGGRGGSGGPGGHGGNGGGGAGGPVAGLLLLGDTVAEVSDSRIRTGDAGAGREPNAGQGGWNYGVYEDAESTYRAQSGVTYDLGEAGNGGPPPGEIAP